MPEEAFLLSLVPCATTSVCLRVGNILSAYEYLHLGSIVFIFSRGSCGLDESRNASTQHAA